MFFYYESESSTFSLLYIFVDFISDSIWSGQGRWLIKAVDRDVELTTLNNSAC